MAYEKVLISVFPISRLYRQHKMRLNVMNKQYMQESEESGEWARDFIKVFVEGVGFVYFPQIS